MEQKRSIVSSLIVVALGIGVLSLSGGIQTVSAIEKTGVVNSRFFPRLMGVLFVFLGGVLVFRDVAVMVRNRSKAGASGTIFGGKSKAVSPQLLRGLSAVGIAVFYALTFRSLGFPISTFLAVVAYSFLFGAKSPVTPLVVGFLVSTLVYVIFRYALGLLFPLGILDGLV